MQDCEQQKVDRRESSQQHVQRCQNNHPSRIHALIAKLQLPAGVALAADDQDCRMLGIE
jgi:hypothetical protein